MLAAYLVDSRKKTHGNRMIFFPNLFLTGIKLFDNLTKLNKTFGIGNDDWPVERNIVRELFARCVQSEDKNGLFRPFWGDVNSGRLARNHGFPLA